MGLFSFFKKDKGKGVKSKEGSAVPISDPKEIQELKKSFSPSPKAKPKKDAPKRKLSNSELIKLEQEQSKKLKSDPIASTPPEPEKKDTPAQIKGHIFEPKAPSKEEKEEKKGQITESLKSVKLQKALERIDQLEEENANLKKGLQREVSSKDAITLSEEEQNQLKEAQNELRSTQESLDQLTGENNELKKSIETEHARFDELEKKFGVFKSEFDHQKSITWAKEETLQNQMVKLQSENEELLKTKEAMEKRKSELDNLNQFKKENEEKVGQLEQELSEVKESNRSLLAQLKQAQDTARKSVEDLEVAKLTYEQKLSDATDRVMSLQGSSEASEEASLDEASKDILAKLRETNDELTKVNQQLSDDLGKIRELNGHLKEKEKVLQYELTKSRAKSVGLEKICEDFKVQIENKEEARNES